MELKPCPFCGEKAAVQSDGFRVWYSVSCDCGQCTDEFRKEEDAIEAWNSRVGEEETT